MARAILDQHRLTNLALVVAGVRQRAGGYSYYSLRDPEEAHAPVDTNGSRSAARRRARERA